MHARIAFVFYLNVAVTGDRNGVSKGLVGRPERKRSLERPRHKLKDIIKMDLQGVGWRAWTERI